MYGGIGTETVVVTGPRAFLVAMQFEFQYEINLLEQLGDLGNGNSGVETVVVTARRISSLIAAFANLGVEIGPFFGIGTLASSTDDGGEQSGVCAIKAGAYVGVTGQAQITGSIAGYGGAGLVADTNGQVSVYGSVGAGAGLAPSSGFYGGFGGGGFVGGTNADFAGPFAVYSGSGADEGGAQADVFIGNNSSNGTPVLGAGTSVGLGAGTTSFTGITITGVSAPVASLAQLSNLLLPGSGAILSLAKEARDAQCGH